MFNKTIVDYINDRYINPAGSAEVYSKRLDLVSKTIGAVNHNFLRGLDLALMSDPELRAEFNYEQRNRKEEQVNYSLLAGNLKRANKIDDDTYIRAAGTLDTVTDPGGANLLQTTVSDVIEKRVEDLGLIKKEVTVFDLEGEGNLKIPTYDAFAKTAFATDAANLVNLGTTVEGGISSITLDPRKHGGYIPIFESFIKKLSGKNMSMVMDLLAEATARGIDDAILNGNGAGENATGMNQNATSVAFTGDALETFRIAMSTVSDAHRGGLNNMTAYMSTAAWLNFMGLFRDLQNDRTGIIDPSNRSIYGVRCIVTDLIPNTGVTPNKESIVTVGYGKSYKWGQSSISIEADKYSGFLSATTNIRSLLFADGQPAFNDSFAKFTMPTLF